MADEAEVPQGLNIGDAISNKLSDSIKNMDVISVLQKLVAMTPDAEDSDAEEIRQKLQAVLKQFDSLEGHHKEEFIQKLKEGLAKKLMTKLTDPESGLPLKKIEQMISDEIMWQLYLYGAAFVAFILLLVFFGYKLYKSIKDKEKRKEEKKKAKQMKKKK